MRRRRLALLALLTVALGALSLPALASGPAVPAVNPAVPEGRETEAVVLTGDRFPGWAAPADASVAAPSISGLQCLDGDNTCPHNRYVEPDATTGSTLGKGVDVKRLLGYRWNGRRFVQIPFQVDEVATRYLANDASTFSAYSETDAHQTYVFDQERFRWFGTDPADPCHAVPLDPAHRTTPDPVPGLDANDELAFMATDAGAAAPVGAPLPKGVVGARRVEVRDPYDPAHPRYAYVMLAGNDKHAPAPAYDASNGYVRYLPDADSDTYLPSQSAYSSYGNAPKGAWRDEATGRCVTDQPRQHRPKDTAWIRTPRYAFSYDGRWLMTQVHVALPGRPWTYGEDLVDEWKARAFQQRPGGDTPCCGYEEEVGNWGGSSVLMGWRAGPVRVIRATWGSDSATNNVRTEVFYRDEFHLLENLRVHAIPPGDGIYAQWDFNAGRVDRYFNPQRPEGVAVDGQNDEVFGNTQVHAGSDGLRLRDADPIPVIGPQNRTLGTPADGKCPNAACIDNDVDVAAPTFSGVGPLQWEQVTGPWGTWIDRTSVRQVTAGAAYALVTSPYYRDDACFDDGTGTDPGVHVKTRSPDPAVTGAGAPRRCWKPSDGDPWTFTPRDTFWQGSIGTHGLHINLIADSDNAFTTVPLDEISIDQRVVLLPGRNGNVGERYGRAFEKPLVVTVAPA